MEVRAATATSMVRSGPWDTTAVGVALEGGTENVVQRSTPSLLQRCRRALACSVVAKRAICSKCI